jgi:hypothetical protein
LWGGDAVETLLQKAFGEVKWGKVSEFSLTWGVVDEIKDARKQRRRGSNAPPQ